MWLCGMQVHDGRMHEEGAGERGRGGGREKQRWRKGQEGVGKRDFLWCHCCWKRFHILYHELTSTRVRAGGCLLFGAGVCVLLHPAPRCFIIHHAHVRRRPWRVWRLQNAAGSSLAHAPRPLPPLLPPSLSPTLTPPPLPPLAPACGLPACGLPLCQVRAGVYDNYLHLISFSIGF